MPDWHWERRQQEAEALTRSSQGVLVQVPGLVDAAAELPVLKALLRISQAVLGAHYFDEVLEVIAEQSLRVLGGASLSISRWEPEHGALRALINVGTLGPADQRWPQNELYHVDGDLHVSELLKNGQPYVNAVDDPDSAPACVDALRELGMESELAVPVMYDDTMWGEIWVTGVDGRRFGPDDIQLLQAIAAHAAVAIGRSELLTTVWRYAHQDPLTGLANRRALDQRFSELPWAASPMTLLICDLDGFKEINDRHGHPAGDTMLREVAATLEGCAQTTDGAMVARLGGDEFCVLLSSSTLAAAREFAVRSSRAVRERLGAVISLSWGAAISAPDTQSGHQLIAAADAALLEAKRQGPGRFSDAAEGSSPVLGALLRRTAPSVDIAEAVQHLVPQVVELLDEYGPLAADAALEVLAVQVQRAINAAAWSISVTTADDTALRTVRAVDTLQDPESGLCMLIRFGESTFALQDYPASAELLKTGGALIASVDLEDSDPAERTLLQQLGYRAVLAVGVPAAEANYLLEIYSHSGYHDLLAVEPHVRVLTRYCVTPPENVVAGPSRTAS